MLFSNYVYVYLVSHTIPLVFFVKKNILGFAKNNQVHDLREILKKDIDINVADDEVSSQWCRRYFFLSFNTDTATKKEISANY